jgi:hypothetical protein
MGSIDAPQSAARSPGESSRCRLHKQCGQWLRCAVPGASHETSSLHRRHRNELNRPGLSRPCARVFNGVTFQVDEVVRERRRARRPNGPQEAPKDPARCATRPRPWSRSSITSPSRVDRTPRPTTVQQTGRPDGNWFSCDLVRPVVARCTAAGSPRRNQKSAGIRSTCPGWMRFGSPMMSRFASRIGSNPVPMYSGSDAAIPDKVSPDWTTCSR